MGEGEEDRELNAFLTFAARMVAIAEHWGLDEDSSHDFFAIEVAEEV